MKPTLKAVVLKAKVYQVRNITQQMGIWFNSVNLTLGARGPKFNSRDALADVFILFYILLGNLSLGKKCAS